MIPEHELPLLEQRLRDLQHDARVAYWLALAALCVGVLGLFRSGAAYAAEEGPFVPVTIGYELPTADCAGNPVDPTELAALEIYVSAAPIPASDQPCPPAGEPVDTPPATFSTRIEVEPNADGSVTREVAIGVLYHLRARVRDADGRWSNLSPELVRDLRSPPPAPTIWFLEL